MSGESGDDREERQGRGAVAALLASHRFDAHFWILAAIVWVAILYGTLGVVRPLTTWLRDHDLLRLFLLCVVAGVGALVAADLWRRRPGPRELAAYAVTLLLYAAAVADGHLYQAIEERLHLIEYGVLGWLVWRAWRARHRVPSTGTEAFSLDALLTFLIVCAVGLVDEGIQDLLPSRVGDWRDVALDALSGLLIVASCWLVSHGRARDRPRSARYHVNPDRDEEQGEDLL